MLSLVPAYFMGSNAAEPSEAGAAVAPAAALPDGVAALPHAASTAPIDAADMPSNVARLMNCRRVHCPLMTPSIACATCPSLVGTWSSVTAILLCIPADPGTVPSRNRTVEGRRGNVNNPLFCSPHDAPRLLEADDELVPLVVPEDLAGDDGDGIAQRVLDRDDVGYGPQRVPRRDRTSEPDGPPAGVQQGLGILGRARLRLREARDDGRRERPEDDDVGERPAARPVRVAVHGARVAGCPGEPQLFVAAERSAACVGDPGARHGVAGPPSRGRRAPGHPGRSARMPSGSSWTW